MTEGEPAPPPAPPADAPGPLDRAFERVPLPPDAPEILAIDGRDERDVWLLGGERDKPALFRWDGAQILKEKAPPCKSPIDYSGLALLPDAAIVLATTYEGEGGVYPVEARRPLRGGWSCDRRSEGQILMLGPDLLRFEPSKQLTLSGHLLPLPELVWIAGSRPQIAARTPAHLWLYFPGHSHVLHGSGVAWESRPTGLAAINDLQVDDTGAAWIIGGDDSKSEGSAVLRWDTAAHAWRRLPTPPDLRATRLRLTSARDVWLIGKEHIHHWDGAKLRRGKTPIERVSGAWISAAGELWIAGRDPSRAAPGWKSAGVAFRAPAVRKP
jgi:hypothetical protein